MRTSPAPCLMSAPPPPCSEQQPENKPKFKKVMDSLAPLQRSLSRHEVIARTRTHTRTHSHTSTHTHMCTHTHACTCTRTHIHTLSPPSLSLPPSPSLAHRPASLGAVHRPQSRTQVCLGPTPPEYPRWPPLTRLPRVRASSSATALAPPCPSHPPASPDPDTPPWDSQLS